MEERDVTGEKRPTMRWLTRCQLLWVCLLLAACGGKRAYLVELKYVPQVPPGVGMTVAAVALAPFVDLRTNKEEVGIRTRLDGGVDRFITTPGSVREGVERRASRRRVSVSEYMSRAKRGVVGTPEECEEQVRAYEDAGVEYLILRFRDMTDTVQLELFA
jgi:alkanesulfonate monooxygenase SsuD/methylene tetrahydromethanopterin reductase-like flavin-dependent oxidoreductase (luciferase family)